MTATPLDGIGRGELVERCARLAVRVAELEAALDRAKMRLERGDGWEWVTKEICLVLASGEPYSKVEEDSKAEEETGQSIEDGRGDVARALVEAVYGTWFSHAPYTDLWREIVDDPYTGVEAALKERDRRRSRAEDKCPARDSMGVPCELLFGHEGPHACPGALARWLEKRWCADRKECRE